MVVQRWIPRTTGTNIFRFVNYSVLVFTTSPSLLPQVDESLAEIEAGLLKGKGDQVVSTPEMLKHVYDSWRHKEYKSNGTVRRNDKADINELVGACPREAIL